MDIIENKIGFITGKFMTDVVIFQEVECDNGKKIAIATLNSPRSLNALSGEMIDLLYPQLKHEFQLEF